MRGTPHKQIQHTPTPAPTQIVLRAIVGSLVVCAALVSPARAQQPASEASKAQPEAETTNITEINTAPFSSLIAKAFRLRSYGSISSDDTFDFQIEADRAEDGTLRNVGFGSVSASNVLWHELAQDFLTALSESRVIAALKDAHHLSMRLKADAQNALASLSFEAPTVERARQLAEGYNMLVHVAQLRGANNAPLLSGFKVSASGKQFTVKLEMTRERLGNLLSQSLALP